LKSLFTKAIADANESVKQELLKAQTGIGSAMDGVVQKMNKSLEKLAIKEAVKKAIKDTMAELEAAGESTTTTTTTGAPGAGSGARGALSDTGHHAAVGLYWSRTRSKSTDPWRDWTKVATDELSGFINKAYLNPSLVEVSLYPTNINPNQFKQNAGGLKQNAGGSRGKTPIAFHGGPINYSGGGPTTGPMHQGIPAVLHGGEYVVRKSAVDKYGSGMLQNINQGVFDKTKGYFTGGRVGSAKGGILDESKGKVGLTPITKAKKKTDKEDIGDRIRYAVNNPAQFAASAKTPSVSYTDPLKDQKLAKIREDFQNSTFGKAWKAFGFGARLINPIELLPIASRVVFGKDIETGEKVSGKGRLKEVGILAGSVVALLTGAKLLKPIAKTVGTKVAPNLVSRISKSLAGRGDELYARMNLGNSLSKTPSSVAGALGLYATPELSKLGSFMQGQVMPKMQIKEPLINKFIKPAKLNLKAIKDQLAYRKMAKEHFGSVRELEDTFINVSYGTSPPRWRSAAFDILRPGSDIPRPPWGQMQGDPPSPIFNALVASERREELLDFLRSQPANRNYSIDRFFRGPARIPRPPSFRDAFLPDEPPQYESFLQKFFAERFVSRTLGSLLIQKYSNFTNYIKNIPNNFRSYFGLNNPILDTNITSNYRRVVDDYLGIDRWIYQRPQSPSQRSDPLMGFPAFGYRPLSPGRMRDLTPVELRPTLKNPIARPTSPQRRALEEQRELLLRQQEEAMRIATQVERGIMIGSHGPLTTSDRLAEIRQTLDRMYSANLPGANQTLSAADIPGIPRRIPLTWQEYGESLRIDQEGRALIDELYSTTRIRDVLNQTDPVAVLVKKISEFVRRSIPFSNELTLDEIKRIIKQAEKGNEYVFGLGPDPDGFNVFQLLDEKRRTDILDFLRNMDPAFAPRGDMNLLSDPQSEAVFRRLISMSYHTGGNEIGISGLYSANDPRNPMANRSTLKAMLKSMAFLFDRVIVPRNITMARSGSTNPFSENFGRSVREMLPGVDWRITGGDLAGTQNDIAQTWLNIPWKVKMLDLWRGSHIALQKNPLSDMYERLRVETVVAHLAQYRNQARGILKPLQEKIPTNTRVHPDAADGASSPWAQPLPRRIATNSTRRAETSETQQHADSMRDIELENAEMAYREAERRAIEETAAIVDEMRENVNRTLNNIRLVLSSEEIAYIQSSREDEIQELLDQLRIERGLPPDPDGSFTGGLIPRFFKGGIVKEFGKQIGENKQVAQERAEFEKQKKNGGLSGKNGGIWYSQKNQRTAGQRTRIKLAILLRKKLVA